MKFEVLNELTCKVTFEDARTCYAKSGSMIGFQGDLKFSYCLLGPGNNIAQQAIKMISRKITGENLPLMTCTPKCPSVGYFADEAQHVTVLNLGPGERVAVESENILMFEDTVQYNVMFLGTGVISQKGLMTSTLTGPGQVALLTDGNPIVLKGPCFVDPDAMVFFTGPQPGVSLDIGLKSIIKRSGESYSLKFTSPDNIVVIQPNERVSGIDIGMDGKGGKPTTQDNNLFRQGGNQMLNGFGNQGGNGFGNSGGNNGLGGLGNILGGIINS